MPVRLHSLPRCDVPDALARGPLTLVALGDFAPSNESAEVLPLDAARAPLRFPSATRAALAELGTPRAFSGYGERRGEAGLDLLLWPREKTCTVWEPARSAGYPGRAAGQALAFSPELGLVLAAGGDDPLVTDAIIGAAVFDVATGVANAVDSRTGGALLEPRAFASATAFGPGFLVAGGQRPVAGVQESELTLNASAEVFDAARGRFTGEPIALIGSRTRHAAVALSDGRTLLIGGRSKFGSDSIAQYQLEFVDPQTLRASVGDVITARIDPLALTLSDGRILVAGGTGGDGAPVQPVAEWLSSEGKLTRTRLSLDVAPRFERAFVAISGGGALAVGGCEDRPQTSDADRAACTLACARGCPPLDGYDAWWIDADGGATPIPLDGIAAPRPVLLPGSDGRPWLVAAAAGDPSTPRLFRFNPWAQRFEAVFVGNDVVLPRAGRALPVAFDRDAFSWAGDESGKGVLLGLRLGSRSRFAQDLALVLAPDADDVTRPAHLVPSRPSGDAVSYDGALTLRSSDVSVQVADTDYADVTVELTLRSEAAPLVELGTSVLGAAPCPWPDGNERGGDFDKPTVVRHATRVELHFHGGKTSCQVPDGRLTLGLRAGSDEAIVTRLDVTRGPPRR